MQFPQGRKSSICIVCCPSTSLERCAVFLSQEIKEYLFVCHCLIETLCLIISHLSISLKRRAVFQGENWHICDINGQTGT